MRTRYTGYIGDMMRKAQPWLGATAVVLTYHRVAEGMPDPQCLAVSPAHFSQHLEVLNQITCPVPLQDLPSLLKTSNRRCRPLSVVTFDDGYADNLHTAKPLLKKHGVPATVFIATCGMKNPHEFWWDDLARLLLRPSLPVSLKLKLAGETHVWLLGRESGSPDEWNVLQTPRHASHKAYLDITARLRKLPQAERRDVLNQLHQWADTEWRARPDLQTLTKNDLRRLTADGLVTVGAHTETHPVLSNLDAASQAIEINKSRDYLKQSLGESIRSFSYPFGRREDYSQQTVELVREAGFSVACTTVPRLVTPWTDPFQLPRFGVRNWTGTEFKNHLEKIIGAKPTRGKKDSSALQTRRMTMKTKIKSALMLMLAIVLPVGAADYYASSIHANRSDSNSGTSPTAPWATFDKVKSAWGGLNAGDTVHLERGSTWNLTFSSDWYISHGGSSSGNITLRGDDYGTGNKPILRRTGGSGNCSFFTVQRSYIIVRDIEMDGGYSNYGKNTSGIVINADTTDLSNVNVLNMFIHNLGGNSSAYICGIWVESWTGRTTSDILIEGNTVSDYAAHGLNHYSMGPLVNVIWRNNIVKNSFTGGRYPSANSAMQIGSGSRGCIIEHNWLEDTTSTEADLFGFGKNTPDTGVNTIRFNVIANSKAYGILFTMDQSGYKLTYDIYGNILLNNARSGIAIYPYNTYASGTRFNIYNNTFYNNCTAGGDGTRGDMELDAQCANTTVDFANNLIFHRNYSTTVGLSVDSNLGGTFSHRNNLYWHEGGTTKNIITHNQTYTVANALSYESTAKNTDPKLVNTAQPPTAVSYASGPTPAGLSLQSSSPAIGAGANLGSSYALDTTRAARVSPWSIGAYEYGGAVVPPDTTPPTVPANLVATAASVSQINLSWSPSINGSIQYKIYRDAAYVGTTTATSYSDSGLTAASSHSYAVGAMDSAGNESAASQPASATTLPASELGLISSATWQNQPFTSQAGSFTVEFDAIPSGAAIDSLIGLSLGNAATYGDLAVIIRFYSNGQIEARNGANYMADTVVTYAAGNTYHFRIEVDVATHRYNVYVTNESGTEYTIATQYAFRDEQATVASLDMLTVVAESGSHQLINFSITTSLTPRAPQGLHVVP